MPELDFILAGVGGQGIILAGDVLAEVGLRTGHDVKKSEVHGMAQRGGVVTSHVRWGKIVRSPLIEPGTAHFVLGFEALEAARAAHYLGDGGVAVVNRYRLPPPSVTAGQAAYPGDDEVEALITGRGATVAWVEAKTRASALGHPALAGVYLLGYLSATPVLAGSVPRDVWLAALERLVPETHRELNRRAFVEGRENAAG